MNRIDVEGVVPSDLHLQMFIHNVSTISIESSFISITSCWSVNVHRIIVLAEWVVWESVFGRCVCVWIGTIQMKTLIWLFMLSEAHSSIFINIYIFKAPIRCLHIRIETDDYTSNTNRDEEFFGVRNGTCSKRWHINAIIETFYTPKVTIPRC